jgi:hypothetical protein
MDEAAMTPPDMRADEHEKRPTVILIALILSAIILIISLWFGVHASAISPEDPQFKNDMTEIVRDKIHGEINNKYIFIFSGIVFLLLNFCMQAYLYVKWDTLMSKAKTYIEIRNRIHREMSYGVLRPISISYDGFKILMTSISVFSFVISISQMFTEINFSDAVLTRFAN